MLRIKRVYLLIACIVLFGFICSAWTLKLPPPPPVKIEKLTGVWVGTDKLEFFIRLELNKSGNGLLFIGNNKVGVAEFYKVALYKHAVYDSPITTFTLSSIVHGKELTITLNGDSPDFMLLTMRYPLPEQNWRVEVPLVRETDLLSGLKMLEQASAQYKAGVSPSKN